MSYVRLTGEMQLAGHGVGESLVKRAGTSMVLSESLIAICGSTERRWLAEE
jgi:hypothetical protein